MNHETTRQHRRSTCSCSRQEALAARKRRLERKAATVTKPVRISVAQLKAILFGETR